MAKFWSKTAFVKFFSSNWRETELIECYLDTSSAKTWQKKKKKSVSKVPLTLSHSLPPSFVWSNILHVHSHYHYCPFSSTLACRLFFIIIIIPTFSLLCYFYFTVCLFYCICLFESGKKTKNRLEACWHKKKKTTHSPSASLKRKKKRKKILFICLRGSREGGEIKRRHWQKEIKKEKLKAERRARERCCTRTVIQHKMNND